MDGILVIRHRSRCHARKGSAGPFFQQVLHASPV